MVFFEQNQSVRKMKKKKHWNTNKIEDKVFIIKLNISYAYKRAVFKFENNDFLRNTDSGIFDD